jgi:hypothetical protein
VKLRMRVAQSEMKPTTFRILNLKRGAVPELFVVAGGALTCERGADSAVFRRLTLQHVTKNAMLKSNW